MSTFNWTVLIYPAIAVPIAILSIVRWRIMRQRQLKQLEGNNNNYNNGFPAQDFVVGNPITAHHTQPQVASVYNIEPAVVHRDTKDPFKDDPTTEDLFKVASKKKDLFKDGSKNVHQDEPPQMIQSKRWF